MYIYSNLTNVLQYIPQQSQQLIKILVILGINKIASIINIGKVQIYCSFNN